MTESPTGQTVMCTISHGHVTRHMLTINQAVHASICDMSSLLTQHAYILSTQAF